MSAADHPWLPLEPVLDGGDIAAAGVLTWLKLDSTNEKHATKIALADLCRMAAADWIEDQRPDLWVTETVEEEEVTTYTPTDRIVSAGFLATARLFSRVDSPTGVVSFDQLQPGAILANDPDMRRMIGRRRVRLG